MKYTTLQDIHKETKIIYVYYEVLFTKFVPKGSNTNITHYAVVTD